METPFKGSHRRLKKVLKKSRPNLSISTHNVYQKKLKSAINVSLNSTRMVRSLQANNKSLAASLEKMRQDFRQVHDHYTRLLEENLGLRQKISELQQLHFSEKIEQEVNKRFQERMALVKKKLSILSSQATSFLDTFTELTEIFYSAKVPTSEDICHTDLSSYDHSPDASARCASQDVSMADTSCCDNVESSSVTGGIETDATAQKTGQSQEKSIAMEQSFLCSFAESITTTSYEHETVSRRAVSSSSIQATLSKLPVRIPKPTREPSKWNSDQVKMVMSKRSKNLSEESAQRTCRRETFVLTSNEHPDEVQCSEIAMPQLLDSDFFDEDIVSQDVDMHISQTDDAATELVLPSPAKKEQPKKRSPNTRKSLRAQPGSPRKKSSPFMIQPTEIHSPFKSSPEQGLPSPSTGNKARKQSLRMEHPSVPKRVSPNKKNPLASKNNENQIMKSFHLHQKAISHSKKKKKLSSIGKKVSPKHFLKSRDKQKEKLFISNEFDLINAHNRKLGNASSAQNSTILANTSQYAGEHTIFPEDDMELTMSMEAGITEEAIRSLTGGIAHGTNERDETGCESDFSKTRSRSKQIGETANEMEEEHREEKVPEAVTMRIPKPGQFVFAAARKESDGTRKNVPVVIPKARSKSKKQLADMIENLPQMEPESIFDFHDKTPVALNTDKQRPTSTEKNSSSPKLPGGKHRSRSRNNNKVSEDLQCVPLSEGAKNKGKTLALLSDNVTFEIPLNDSSPASKLPYRTRSHSRSRQQTESDKSKDETDARFLICRKSTHTGTQALPKTPCSPRHKHDEQQPTNLTSPETPEHQHTPKVVKRIEYAADDNGRHRSLKYSNSDVVFNQDVSSDVQVETQENIHKGTFIRTRSRTHITDQKKEPSRKAQAEETTNITTPLLAVDLCQEPNQTSEKLHAISFGSDTEHIEAKSARDDTRPRASSTNCCQDRVQLSSGAVTEETASVSGSVEDLAANQSAVVSDGVYSVESTDATSESNTSENAAADKVPSAELRRKKVRSKLQPKRGKEASPQLLNEGLKSVVCTDFVSNRAERTRGKKGDKIMCGEFEAGRKSKSIEDLSADGDYSDKTRPTKLKDLQWDPEEVSSECSSHLQEKVNHDQLAFLSQNEKKMQEATSAESSVRHRTPEGKKQGPQISKVLKISSPNKPKVHIERPAILNSTEGLTVVHGKRRAAAKVSYAELPLNAKLRRGDPFTSHYCTTDKIDIFKSPKSKVKKKVPRREVLGSLHNTSIQEESLPTERNSQVND